MTSESTSTKTIIKSPISFQETGFFGSLFLAYLNKDLRLEPYINRFPDIGAFEMQIKEKEKQFSPPMRALLKERLTLQMGHELSPAQVQNLAELESPRTFTISCGHQLNLAGGPLYVAYKILTVIALAEKLTKQFPEYRFVPLHWLASEDHDNEEISAFRFFGQSYQFQFPGEGAVGPMKTADLASQLAAIKDIPSWMSEAYGSNLDLTLATRKWLQHCFGNQGLLVLDGNDVEFKKAFFPLAWKEIEQPWVEKAVLEDTQKLQEIGFKEQIHPRPINLFYLAEGVRTRLEWRDGKLATTDGKQAWKKEEAKSFFEANPQSLSPNVAFRPLYSQIILPDLAFVGGPAEVAYWMQLKSVFGLANVSFPMLIPRFSALYMPHHQARKWQKTGLSTADLFKEMAEIKRELLLPEGLLPDLETIYSGLIQWASEVDPTLVGAVKAELTRMEKQAEGLQKRIQKAAELKNEQQMQQILNLKAKLFPDGGLQERTESWLSFLVQDPNWLETIKSCIDPMDFRFQVLLESD